MSKIVILVLGLLVTTAPARSVELPPILKCTPLDELLSRGGSLPANDHEWDQLFHRLDATGPDIYFSQSNAHTSLLEPRRIFLAQTNGSETVNGGSFFGRLFVAVGKNDEGRRVAEFITAPARGHYFLFGTIDPKSSPPVRVEPMLECKQCHKTEGLEYTIYPWRNASSNINHPVALVRKLAERYPKQYGPVAREIDRLLAKVREPIEPLSIHGGEKKSYGPFYYSPYDDRGRVEEAFEKSAILQHATYQGVPIFRNIVSAGGADHSGAERLFRIVEVMGGPLAYAQALELLPHESRADFLRQGILTALGFHLTELRNFHSIAKLPKGLGNVPAFHSSLTLDSDATSNRVFDKSAITDVNAFFRELVRDPERIDEILAYDARRESAGGRHPGDSAMDPKISARYDWRGVPSFSERYLEPAGKLDDRVEVVTKPYLLDIERLQSTMLHPFALTVADFEYVKSIIESRGATMTDALEFVVESGAMKAIYERGKIPSRSELKVALMSGLGAYFSEVKKDDSVAQIPPSDYLSEFDRGCLERLEAPSPAGQACLRCHGSQSEIYHYVSDREAWKQRLAEKDPRALSYARKIKKYLAEGTMPPPHTPERFEFEPSSEKVALEELLRAY